MKKKSEAAVTYRRFYFLWICFLSIITGAVLHADEASDAKTFFADMSSAAAKTKTGDAQAAAAVLEALVGKVTATPWAEIAQFKRTQLVENFDVPQARAAYQKLRSRVETPNAAIASPALKTALIEGARNGIKRLAVADVRTALDTYYKKNVEYPDTLQVLVEKKLLPPEKISDESGKPLEYRVMADPILSKIPKQKYAMDFAPPKPFAVEEFMITGFAGGADNLSVLLRSSRGVKAAKAGEKFDSYTIALVRDEGVILCDNDNIVVVKPK